MSTCSRPACGSVPQWRGLCGRHWAAGRAAGTFGYTSSAPVVTHIKALNALGWTSRTIAAKAGVDPVTVRRVGKRPMVLCTTAAGILSVERAPFTSLRHSTDSIGSMRRARALLWMGWETTYVADRVGVRLSSLLNAFKRGSISTEVASRVAALYAEIGDRPGPSHYARKKARTLGYAPPAAWDGLDMDDPKVKPEGVRRAA